MTINDIQTKKGREKIVMLPAYDAITAKIAEGGGVDCILVGDSLANTALGYADTLSVTLDAMLHHAGAVTRNITRCPVIFDMPFLSTSGTESEAVLNCGRALQEAGCTAVKIEGGAAKAGLISRMVDSAIPVMGHIGLMPQYVRQKGGMFVQGKDAASADAIVLDAHALVKAGVFAIVVECVPTALGKRLAEEVSVPVIGIGAGPHCDGQVLVIADMLGMEAGSAPKHARQYATLFDEAVHAVAAFTDEVRSGEFPSETESFTI